MVQAFEGIQLRYITQETDNVGVIELSHECSFSLKVVLHIS